MNTTYLLLGSNDGERLGHIQSAMVHIKNSIGEITRQSKIYETAAWGLEDQPDFLNIAIEVQTGLSPEELLKKVDEIEHILGRKRTIKWGQRTLDIDILFYNNLNIYTQNLRIPHPFIAERRFALVPLNDIAADYIHPATGTSVAKLLENCEDPLAVQKYNI